MTETTGRRGVDEQADVEAGLRSLIAAEVPDAADVEITDLRRTSSGYSRENWPFDVSWRDGSGSRSTRRLILRRDPVGSVLETDRRVEFGVLKALEGSAVPAPHGVWLDGDGRHLGRPSVVMERLDGVCDWFVLSGGSSMLPEDERVALAGRLADMLARIHQVDWRGAHLDDVVPDPGADPAAAAIAEWEAVLHRQQLEPQPELELVVSWLYEHRTPAQATVLVHADYKPGNVLLHGSDIVAVLDWELAHLGDPMEDIGWITNPLRAREHQIPGRWERNEIYRRYEAASGFTVDERQVHFWNVFANFKLATISLTGARTAIEGRGDRVFGAPTRLVQLMYSMIGA